MRFDLESLRVFATVVEQGSIAEAAQTAHIVASAVSRRISELERDAGTPLFERHSRGVRPTAAGRTLYRHVRRIFEQFQQAEGELDEYTKGVRGHVRLSVNFTAMVYYLPQALQRFLSANSAIKIDLIEKTSDAVVRMVESGMVDFGICSLTEPEPRLTCFPYQADRLFLIAPAHHRYAGCASLRFDDILDEDFVGMQDGASIYTLSQRAAAAAGRRLKLRIQVTSFEAVRNMVAAGLGIGLLPEIGIPDATPGLVKIRLDEPWVERSLQIVCRDPDALPAAARQLIGELLSTTPIAPPPDKSIP
ncbi:DNA-binding transcriptional LysR family regulator [Paraburkholderia caballeronis]|uniref:LysR family transcriptional regulator n=1 Tax=Paraburkholderia caballeronis TaxID=416943 RepID=UPI001065B157|nr:LysR family transcriptional regulator [Paraburkholderia caballeronis]TDV33637.1 DNA-binding transcriptional LysR family regulator [Paraburkholderia caballeronis]